MPTFFTVERKRVKKGSKKTRKRVTQKRKVYLVGHRNPGRWVVSKPARGSKAQTVREPQTIIPLEALIINASQRAGDKASIEISFEGSHSRSNEEYQDIVFGGGSVTEGLDDRWPFVEDSQEEIEAMVDSQIDDKLSEGIHLLPDLMGEDFLSDLAYGAAKIVAQNIRNMSSPPNAPATIRRKGFNDPLVETGQMQDSIIVDISVT